MANPNAIYQTPDDFRKAYKAYLKSPKIITVWTKDGPTDAAIMNYDGVAVELGFSSRQGIYDQAKRKGEGWKEVVEEFKSEMKAFWYAYGGVGNSGFATWVLSVMGEKPPEEEKDDKPMRIEIVDAVANENTTN